MWKRIESLHSITSDRCNDKVVLLYLIFPQYTNYQVAYINSYKIIQTI